MGATMTSRDFNRDVSAAKRAAESGPVTITDHGRRSHVLLTAADYDDLVARGERVGTRFLADDGIEIPLLDRRAWDGREVDL